MKMTEHIFFWIRRSATYVMSVAKSHMQMWGEAEVQLF
jgi:hypothetical protein